MSKLIRMTTSVPNTVDRKNATAFIPAGETVTAEAIDTEGIAWVPHENETYMVFPTEYEVVEPTA